MTLEEVIERIRELANQFDPESCIDFAYYASEELDNILLEYDNAN